MGVLGTGHHFVSFRGPSPAVDDGLARRDLSDPSEPEAGKTAGFNMQPIPGPGPQKYVKEWAFGPCRSFGPLFCILWLSRLVFIAVDP